MRMTLFIALAFILCVGSAQAEGVDTLYYANLEPFVLKGNNGRISGPLADIVQLVFAEAQAPLSNESFRIITWPRAMDNALHRAGSGILGVAKTPQREHSFKWVGPMGEVTLGLWAKKSRRIRPKIFEELHMYKVGVVRSSAPEHILINECRFTTGELERLCCDASMLKMLDVGWVDMVVLSDKGAGNTLSRHGLNPDDYERIWVLKKLELYLALNTATDDDLVARLQAALDRLKSLQPDEEKSRFQQIYDSYQ